MKHGEGELHDLIEKERTRLNANEFLNIDAILEAVLHKIVLCEFFQPAVWKRSVHALY